MFVSSCGLFPPGEPRKAKTVTYQWHDDGGPDAVNIEIDLSKEIATYRRADRVIGWSFVSTGKEGHSTAPGNYTITEKLPLAKKHQEFAHLTPTRPKRVAGLGISSSSITRQRSQSGPSGSIT